MIDAFVQLVAVCLLVVVLGIGLAALAGLVLLVRNEYEDLKDRRRAAFESERHRSDLKGYR